MTPQEEQDVGKGKKGLLPWRSPHPHPAACLSFFSGALFLAFPLKNIFLMNFNSARKKIDKPSHIRI